ncbi:MAG TPA: acetate--CoA ligase [Chitinophagales bacterium]|nr:acetate--CoA ligase [Chitinophagales bacterium]HMV02077.1 acetate--CoA ligase [Chitinophagales bacterium]HMW93965.1 acetate--CoA ligase [Chitinophagales bacterium]HMY41827.1 acetate--CoA ligase [Chitinophagales bacterium]HMZ68192.1 acetate--CoA ligase [Chitinophagales bacterium]
MYPYQIKTLENYHKAYKDSVEQPEKFWFEIAQHFKWKKQPTLENTLHWNFKEPKIEWFRDGTLNITENCLDRHLEKNGNTPALIFEPNAPEDKTITLTYKELHHKVCQFAHVLKNNGVKKGDRVCIYMGMVPELSIAMLACARIGAIHSIIFGGFSANSISSRLEDTQAEFVITQDGSYRGNKEIELKKIMDEALENSALVKKVIVFRHTNNNCKMKDGRDMLWQDEITKVEAQGNPDFPAVEMNAEDPLYILYTSGSTGKPKGVVHTCGGYMVYTNYTFVNVFQYQPGDIFFCTADIGWVTGHSYIVYGPLSAGATSLMFEGIPTFPDAGRFWDIVDKYKVNILYTAPTAIRSLMAYGDSIFDGKDLSSLKVLGSVGEPINEEAWHWYYDKVGKGRCPIVDTWWQTENGGILISGLAGITPMKAAHASFPLPGIQPILMDEKATVIEGSDASKSQLPTETISGNLCIQFPWPGMLRTTYRDHERCRLNYFSAYDDKYFTGDGCLRDTEGNYRITGRVDDVLNVSGHRIGTAEVENAINEHPLIVESAVVGYPHDIKGQGIYAYIILQQSSENFDAQSIKQEVNQVVTKIIGAIAKPDKIQIVKGLPKTRSGKIMRRILRKIAEGDTSNLGDTSALLEPAIVDSIKEGKVL